MTDTLQLIAPADRHKPWARLAAAQRLKCVCPTCLREAGITPDGGCAEQHRVRFPKTEPQPLEATKEAA